MAAATRKAGGPSAGGQGVVVPLRAAQTNFRKFPQAIRRSCTSPLGGEVHEKERSMRGFPPFPHHLQLPRGHVLPGGFPQFAQFSLVIRQSAPALSHPRGALLAT